MKKLEDTITCLREFTNVVDRRTDRWTPHDDIGHVCTASRGKNSPLIDIAKRCAVIDTASWQHGGRLLRGCTLQPCTVWNLIQQAYTSAGYRPARPWNAENRKNVKPRRRRRRRDGSLAWPNVLTLVVGFTRYHSL